MVCLLLLLLILSLEEADGSRLSQSIRDKQSEELWRRTPFPRLLAERGVRLEPNGFVWISDHRHHCRELLVNASLGHFQIDICQEDRPDEAGQCRRLRELVQKGWQWMETELLLELELHWSRLKQMQNFVARILEDTDSPLLVGGDDSGTTSTSLSEVESGLSRQRRLAIATGLIILAALGVGAAGVGGVGVALGGIALHKTQVNAENIYKNGQDDKEWVKMQTEWNKNMTELTRLLANRTSELQLADAAKEMYTTRLLPRMYGQLERRKQGVREALEHGRLGEALLDPAHLFDKLKENETELFTDFARSALTFAPGLLYRMGSFQATYVHKRDRLIRGQFCFTPPSAEEIFLLAHPIHEGAFAEDGRSFARPQMTRSFLVSMRALEEGDLSSVRYVDTSRCEPAVYGFQACPSTAITDHPTDGGCPVDLGHDCRWRLQPVTANFTSYVRVNGQPIVATTEKFFYLSNQTAKRIRRSVDKPVDVYKLKLGETATFGATRVHGALSFTDPPRTSVNISFPPLPGRLLRNRSAVIQGALDEKIKLQVKWARDFIERKEAEPKPAPPSLGLDWNGLWSWLDRRLGWGPALTVKILVGGALVLLLLSCCAGLARQPLCSYACGLCALCYAGLEKPPSSMTDGGGKEAEGLPYYADEKQDSRSSFLSSAPSLPEDPEEPVEMEKQGLL